MPEGLDFADSPDTLGGMNTEPVGTDLRARVAAIPRVDAVRPVSGLARWKATWSRRHTVTLIVAAPVLTALYMGVVSPTSAAVIAALVVAGVLAGGVVASYVPAAGQSLRSVFSGSCAVVPALAVPAVTVLLSQGTATGLAFTVAILTLSVIRRATSPDAC